MRAVVQRVLRAMCRVDGEVVGEIGPGLVALVAVSRLDGVGDPMWLADKIAGLRIFADAAGKMNRDVRDVGGAVLAVPQFTLYGDSRRGRRPDFLLAAPPGEAEPQFDRFCDGLASRGVTVARGRFREHMEVELVNDGPVTLLIDTPIAPPEPGT